jgi:PLP dependent protein
MPWLTCIPLGKAATRHGLKGKPKLTRGGRRMTSKQPLPDLSAEDTLRFGEDPVRTFRTNFEVVEERISRACARAGRDRASVQLLPITKTVPAPVLRLAFAAGIRSFGENWIQEAQGKQEALADLPVTWSIVGHLQTNKAKVAARIAHEFHALDSLRLAEALQGRLERED